MGSLRVQVLRFRQPLTPTPAVERYISSAWKQVCVQDQMLSSSAKTWPLRKHSGLTWISSFSRVTWLWACALMSSLGCQGSLRSPSGFGFPLILGAGLKMPKRGSGPLRHACCRSTLVLKHVNRSLLMQYGTTSACGNVAGIHPT